MWQLLILRLLKRNELQETLSNVYGAFEFGDPPNPDSQEIPFCIQNYVVPRRDMRYVASFSDTQGVSCSVFARRFSSRYSHPLDSDAMDAAGTIDSNAVFDGLNNTPATSNATMSAEELLVESQLVAMGLLEARPLRNDASSSGFDNSQLEQHVQAPKRIRIELTRTLSTVSSFTERAHGARLMGLVVEFVAAAPSAALATAAAMPISGGSNSEILVLMAVHAVQIDSKGSRGRMGTFTERWQDYLAGMGPPPAPQVPSRRINAPSLLRGADNSVVKADRNGVVVRSMSISNNSNNGLVSAPGNRLVSSGGNTGALTRPLSSGRIPSSNNAGMHLSSGGNNHLLNSSPNGHPNLNLNLNLNLNNSTNNPLLPSSPGHNGNSPTTNSNNNNNMGGGGGGNGRPVERPLSAQVLKVGRDIPNSAHSSSNNGHYTLRNALSAARPGSGGNPTASPASPDAYLLWTQRQVPHENVAASLAMELESTRERLQRQTDLALRAESALAQLAQTSHQQITELREQNEELRTELDRTITEKRKLEEEIERSRLERAQLMQEQVALSAEVERLKAELSADRETLTQAMRSNAGREDSLEVALRHAKEEKESIQLELTNVTRRLEEEKEVVEAVKSQLVEYKNAVAVLQTQVRRGKNNKPLAALPNMPALSNSNAASEVNGPRVSQMATQRSAVNVSSSNI
eukprot:CAMPEP_0175044678 /NCGR_PEP_ID=MMETSP0052_2-20121109/3957_1 /TAXON_ID=51329 ORGANISM="Polytomella parva, Strain SAG 63-3" /NCGR_SAMPLE_ID=MMETSP0052_2 /ASSEMBLY_ACC=CAM_ASM_000194 /LENGTH=689 /DNA_ID=CAMNT_0016308037 /DNA_START=274 /DNA_END=2340 /DNA_ORIENTATION=+